MMMNNNPKLIVKNDGLVITNLGKSYSKKPVVRSVSLKIQRGEAVGLLGPNGAGKTTCFYLICGLIKPDYGKIFLNNEDITDTPIYKRAKSGIGYLPQEISIFRGMTVEQNIRAILALNIQDRREREIHLEELLAEFSLTHLRRASSLSLSGGERRKVEIARTLAMQPSFILLDEPLAGIDPIAIEEIRVLIKHIKDRGVGVLITDHNVKETLELIDRAYIMHDGKILMDGQPNEIIEDENVRKVYLGEKFNL
jgi:lipopolysaccharide export system ATP-binding protein